MDFKKIFDLMIHGERYYTSKEIEYDKKVGIHLSPYEYRQFVLYKNNNSKDNKFCKNLQLKTFNDYSLFFCYSSELVSILNSFLNLVITDSKQNNKPMSVRNMDEMTLSRIYSEVEGTLNIESVQTTRKVVADIAQGKRDPKTLNEQIIKNMIDGIEFVNKCPDFNKENLYLLYSILSNGCLDEEDKLLEGNYYRHDGVEVGGYKGCPFQQIKESMDCLFDFVKANMTNSDLLPYLPHIAHYYILYIHPYFDYNGRTARMVSYWISLLTNKLAMPTIISEAINQTKSDYYSAISETRDAGNDLTYFLTYIFNISIDYFLAYKNLEEVDQMLKNQSIILTSLEKNYFKKILVCNKGKFTHNDFSSWVDINMSKQGALKILNNLCSYGLLISTISKSNKKIFEVNSEVIKYSRK